MSDIPFSAIVDVKRYVAGLRLANQLACDLGYSGLDGVKKELDLTNDDVIVVQPKIGKFLELMVEKKDGTVVPVRRKYNFSPN
jgi:hypothetical protein